MPVSTEIVQKLHPDEKIVDVTIRPAEQGGGMWALSENGAVYSLDEQGNFTGGSFYGSYLSESTPSGFLGERDRNDPNRRFVAIQADARTGGYVIRSKNDEEYGFFDPAYQPPAGGPGTIVTPPKDQPVPQPAPGVTSEEETFRAFFDQMRLGGIATKAWEHYKAGGATTVEEIMPWLKDQPEFQTRFPGMAVLEEKNIFWSPAEYLKYESGAFDILKRSGANPEFWNEDTDIATLLAQGWSLDELQDAADQALNAVVTMPAEAKAAFAQFFGTGDLVSYYLNPDKATPLLERKFNETVARIGGAATTSEFGAVSQAEARRLATLGLSPEQAAQEFTRMGLLAPLFAETASEREDLGREAALGAIGGEATSIAAIERRRRSRQAAFEGGGGAASGGEGTTGLGSAR